MALTMLCEKFLRLCAKGFYKNNVLFKGGMDIVAFALYHVFIWLLI